MFNSRYVVEECTNNEEEQTTMKQLGLAGIQGNPAEGIYPIPRRRDVKTPRALEFHSDADLDRTNSSKRTDELADLNKPLPLEEDPPLVPDINITSITCLEDGCFDGEKFSPKSLKEDLLQVVKVYSSQPVHQSFLRNWFCQDQHQNEILKL